MSYFVYCKEMSYLSCDLVKDTGGRILQIANVLYLAGKNKMTAVFKNDENTKTLFEVFFCKKLNTMSVEEFNKISFNVHSYNSHIESQTNTMLIGVPEVFQQSKEDMQELVYSYEDFMYEAYQAYTHIKKLCVSDNDDNYVACYISKNDDIESLVKKCNLMNKYIVVFTDNFECREYFDNLSQVAYFVKYKNDYHNIIMFSLFKHLLFDKSSNALCGSYVSNTPGKIIYNL